jgi:hypothetical protein
MLNRNHQKDAEKTSVYHYLSRILPTYFFGGGWWHRRVGTASQRPRELLRDFLKGSQLVVELFLYLTLAPLPGH